MKIQIEFAIDNAAFTDYEEGTVNPAEVARVIGIAAEKAIRLVDEFNAGAGTDYLPLADINGGTVGRVTLTEG